MNPEERIAAALAIHAEHVRRPAGKVESECVCTACRMARALTGEEG